MSDRIRVSTHRCPDLVDRIIGAKGDFHSRVTDRDSGRVLGNGYSQRSSSEARDRALDKASERDRRR